MATMINSFVGSFNNKLEQPVRTHLKNVYACLTMTTMTAALGAYLSLVTEWFQGGFLSAIAAVGIVFALAYNPDDGKNTRMRIGLLLGFGLLSGMGMGPLLQYVIALNPSILVTALLGTTLVFVSFTAAAMLADRGRWLYLGGTLMTLLSTLAILSITNIFFRSQMLYQIHIYLGLALMCGFVLYDTQLIIEKRRMGNKDFVTHALDLFIDFIGILKRLLILLSQKEEQDRRRKRD